jgi:hypothetical protein
MVSSIPVIAGRKSGARKLGDILAHGARGLVLAKNGKQFIDCGLFVSIMFYSLWVLPVDFF